MDGGYQNCSVRVYRKRESVEDRALESEEKHTEGPEKCWPERWEEKEGGDQVTEMCVWGDSQEGVVNGGGGCSQPEKVSSDKGPRD